MESFLKHLRDNWLVLGFLVMVVMTYTTFNSQLADATSVNTSQSQQISALQNENVVKDARLQNMESNIYIICRIKAVNCIPPLTK